MKEQSMRFVFMLMAVSVCMAAVFSLAPPGESAGKTITIGVAPFPNKDITEVAAGLLKKEGYTLKIKVYTNSVDPNIALNDKSLDANYFQTIPYLVDQMHEMTKYKFKWLAKIHKEPMGIYSAKYMRSAANLPADPIIAIPDDLPNQSRALHLLEYAGLILLKDGTMSNTNDILQNKQGIAFLKADAKDMPKILSRVDAAVMDTATAIKADMNPKRDAVVLEPINDVYSNVLVVRASDANKPEIKALVKAFTSPKVKQYIGDKLYSYGIVPAF